MMDMQKLRARQQFASLPRDEQLNVFLGLATAFAFNRDAGIASDDRGDKYLVKNFRGFEFEGTSLK